MPQDEKRTAAIIDRADEATRLIKLIKDRVKKNKHIDASDFTDLDDIIASLRHNCDMHNTERLT